MKIFGLAASLVSCSCVVAQSINWTASPFTPTALPLAVRSPYLNIYQPAGSTTNLGDLSNQWASFWNGNYQPWCGGVLVDGASYTWMGTPGDCVAGKAEQQSANFTASQTIFIMRAGGIDLTVEFLSPITPGDPMRQSLPYSYLSVSAASNDGLSHSVQLYSDIGAEFASGADTTQNITWSTSVLDAGLLVHQVSLLKEWDYGEVQDYSRDSTVVYATDNSSSTTYCTGAATTVRASFVADARLSNSQDTLFRAIDDNEPVFAFARNLGNVSSTPSAAMLLILGNYHTPAINWTAVSSASPNRQLYFMSEYPSLETSLAFFFSDYTTSYTTSNAFDLKVQEKAVSLAGTKYAALCALAARQVFGAVEISIGQDSQGNYNTSDVMVFMKEIATSNYIQTLDVIWPSIPFFLYYDDEFVRYLIEPLLRFTASGVYPNAWASHNLGYAYPNATGHPDGKDPAYYLEETGNAVLMAALYASSSGKTDQISQYYPVLQGWAQFLVNDSYWPREQASTDDFQGSLANQTNLAVKGILGLRAMSDIATTLGQTADAANYLAIAQNYTNHFMSAGMSTDGTHIKLAYDGDDDTWSTLYNLLPDKLLNYSLFPASLYTLEAEWYGTKSSTYGIPLDSRNNNVKSDWEMTAAAIFSSTNTTIRDLFIDGVYNYLSFGNIPQAFPDMYELDGSSTSFVARPVVGAAYSLLALDKMNAT